MLRKIAWKNIVRKPLSSALCVSLLLFGVGIISLLLLIQHQLEQKFERDLNNIDLVVGASGSPLQLVLSAVYHLDAPTGNINFAEAKKIMEHPMVKQAIPLAYGDSYRGYRILGTTPTYLDKYAARVMQGEVFENTMEVTLGANVAVATGLSVGDEFLGTHGEAQTGGHLHDEHPYTVVGILENTHTVLDDLVLTDLSSVWEVHHESEASGPKPTEEEHHHNHGHHDHEIYHENSPDNADEKDITAVLLEYKTKMATLSMPRMIKEQTNLQAVIPALEINRLFYLLGVEVTTLQLIAGGIMAMAGFSVFFVLYSRLRERRYELALLRSVGYRPWQLFGLLLLEGCLLAGIGYVLGWLLSRGGLYLINLRAESDFNFQFRAEYVSGELGLLLITFLLGIVAALLPAWQAMRTDVSDTLSQK